MALLPMIRLALRTLAANKLRAALTMLGVIIGVASVVALLSIGNGVSNFIGDQIENIGSNLLTITPSTHAAGARLTLADADALAGAVAHILVNAYEAVCSRSSRRVSLHVRCTGVNSTRSLVFAVSDNGPGIPDEVRSKLFSPFCTTKPRGLGLGLPLARRAAVDHGGRMDVDSTPQGTTVTLTLPLEGRRTHAEAADR